MRFLLLLIMTATLFNLPSFSQDWMEVGGGTDDYVRTMYPDTSHHVLYVGGDFQYAGSVLVHKIAKWNHLSWDSLGPGIALLAGFGVHAITNFKDTIIASGCFFNQFPYDFYIAQWNGTHWDSLGQNVNSYVETLKVISDTLYVGGYFDRVNTTPTNLLAKWDGQNWYGFNLPLSVNGTRITCIEDYQGRIYIGGRFWDTSNVWINNIAQIDNNHLYPVDTELSNPSSSAITSLVVYNGELYIGGIFGTGSSGLGSNIVKWDGNSLSSVGGGTDFDVEAMTVFNNELYVAGRFSFAGTVPAQYIARWNGTSWHSVGNSYFDNPIFCIAVLDSELYVGGVFTNINGHNVSRIAKYIGPLNVPESGENFNINVFPNPVGNLIKVVSEHLKIISLSFRDILNNEIAHINLNTTEFSYDSGNLQAGVYFLQIETERGRVVRKFVKE